MKYNANVYLAGYLDWLLQQQSTLERSPQSLNHSITMAEEFRELSLGTKGKGDITDKVVKVDMTLCSKCSIVVLVSGGV